MHAAALWSQISCNSSTSTIPNRIQGGTGGGGGACRWVTLLFVLEELYSAHFLWRGPDTASSSSSLLQISNGSRWFFLFSARMTTFTHGCLYLYLWSRKPSSCSHDSSHEGRRTCHIEIQCCHNCRGHFLKMSLSAWKKRVNSIFEGIYTYFFM